MSEIVSEQGSAGPSSDREDLPSNAYRAEQERDSELSEVLQTLPSYITRGLLYLVAAFLAVGFAFTAFSRIDVIRDERAAIVPEGDVQSLQPPVEGVLKELLVREGDQVVKDQPLAIIESREVGLQLAAVQSTEMDLRDAQNELREIIPVQEKQTTAQIEILGAKTESLQKTEAFLKERIEKAQKAYRLAEETFQLELAKTDETLARMQIELDNASGNHGLWSKELEAMQNLVARNAASQLEYLSIKRSQEAAAGEVKKLHSMLREVQRDREIIEKKRAEARNQHEAIVADLSEEIAKNRVSIESTRLETSQLQGSLEILRLQAKRRHEMAQFRHRQATEVTARNLTGVSPAILEAIAAGKGEATNQNLIRAPADGRVGPILVRSPGEAVRPGHAVLTLIPAEAALVAEIVVANRDAGLVREGLPVRLKFDAFPFAEHGVITGELTKVVPVAEQTSPGQSHYRAYARLDQDYFLVDGTKTRLLPGMAATAEITTETKTILELLLKPFLELRKARRAEG